MQDEIPVGQVWVLVDMVNSVGIERRGASLDAVNLVSFAKQEFCQVGPVLTGNAGDECAFFQFKSPGIYCYAKNELIAGLYCI